MSTDPQSCDRAQPASAPQRLSKSVPTVGGWLQRSLQKGWSSSEAAHCYESRARPADARSHGCSELATPKSMDDAVAIDRRDGVRPTSAECRGARRTSRRDGAARLRRLTSPAAGRIRAAARRLAEEEIFHVLGDESCASFCHGIRRYSLRIIFMRSSQSFHASTETLSKMRWPSSPGHGGASSPGSSFWNFTHMTLRPLLLRRRLRRRRADRRFSHGRDCSALSRAATAAVPASIVEAQARVRRAQRALDRRRARRRARR